MANMVNQWERVRKQKLKYGALSVVCSLFVLIGFLLNDYLEADFYFFILFINILIVLATAYCGVKFIMYLPFKTSPYQNMELLEQLSSRFCILNGILLNNENYRAYFEHVIIGPSKMYFIHLGGQDFRKEKQYHLVIKDIINTREIKMGYKIIYNQIDFDKLVNQLKNHEDSPITNHQKKIVDIISRIAV